jgi:uncharacterized protein YkwD
MKRAIVVLALVLATALPASAAQQRLENSVLGEINAVRVEHGLLPLRSSSALRHAAQEHSLEMASDGYFGHESEDGTAFWRRIQGYYGSRGYKRWSAGENLIWASPGLDADEALHVWLQSAPHRENLLSRDWREIGLGAVHAVAPGLYGGEEVTILTADFGARS